MHEGHRQRMYQRLKEGSSICDHELLEIFLFSVFPRKNTNPIAHSLIDAFGSIAGVLEADFERLMTVQGVGENIALFLACTGEIFRRAREVNSGIAVLKNYEDIRTFTTVRMRGKCYEVLEIYCIEKSGRIKRIFTFTDTERSKVEVRAENITEIISKEKPHGILVAHNHLSGNSAPSVNDDRFTAELQVMCSINNVVLYDHCIYASDKDIYSYFAAGKIDDFRRDFSFKGMVDRQLKLLAEQMENNNK